MRLGPWILCLALLGAASDACAQGLPRELPGVPPIQSLVDDDAPATLGGDTARLTIELGPDASKDGVATTVKIALILTVLSLAPAILVTATSFTRIVIVLGFVRVGLQTPAMPPNQVVVGLALSLTFLSMGPVFDEVYECAARPYMDEELSSVEALERATVPARAFLLRHTRDRTLAGFVDMAELAPKEGEPELTPDTIPLRVLLPAFVVSELTTAFEMGVVILIPFLVIDLVAASVLLSTNMIMLPPATVAIPMKVLLFVLVDGWALVVRSVVSTAG
ncbi:MAG: flagellar type III secretion system pore protein FliP [Planctomycetes bacterium]|nr:flagellar type III secretion system pore protein FliP [Planctomycetota bacterium]